MGRENFVGLGNFVRWKTEFTGAGAYPIVPWGGREPIRPRFRAHGLGSFEAELFRADPREPCLEHGRPGPSRAHGAGAAAASGLGLAARCACGSSPGADGPPPKTHPPPWPRFAGQLISLWPFYGLNSVRFHVKFHTLETHPEFPWRLICVRQGRPCRAATLRGPQGAASPAVPMRRE